MKILVAGGDDARRTELQVILSKWGFDVVLAVDGLDAYAKFSRDNAIKMAIVHQKVPDLNIGKLCRALKKRSKEIPFYLIVLMDADMNNQTVNEIITDADDFVVKPYSEDELRLRVNIGHCVIRLKTELKKQEEIKNQLKQARAMCHELNQPLQIISGFSEMLLQDLAKDHFNFEAIENIKQGVDRFAESLRKLKKIVSYDEKKKNEGNK